MGQKTLSQSESKIKEVIEKKRDIWSELESRFNRALLHCISKKKFFMVLPILISCGVMIVFCRAIAFDASRWVTMSLVFMPMLLTSGILLSLGVLLIKIYNYEVCQIRVNYKDILSQSWEVVVGSAYLTLPTVLVYLCLWILLGIFLLLREIPGIGEFFGIVLSFAPFLLILSSIVLIMVNIGLLFFLAPAAALKSMQNYRLAQKIWGRLRQNLFSNLALFTIAMFPTITVVGILSLAAFLTGINFSIDSHSLSVGMSWFFIMLPFCACLTPAVLFFFHFAAEAHDFLYRKLKEEGL